MIRTVQQIVSFLIGGNIVNNDATGYLHTGNDTYITRKGDARSLVSELNREQIWAYIAPHIKQKGR